MPSFSLSEENRAGEAALSFTAVQLGGGWCGLAWQQPARCVRGDFGVLQQTYQKIVMVISKDVTD
jgi:hypothetical protein